MNDAHFEKIVSESIDTLPEHIRKQMHNVAIVIEDIPPIGEDGVVYGLYERVPLTDRGVAYDALPDKITIFKQPILDTYSDEVHIKKCIQNTVWHEVAHHFGFGEEWIKKEEKDRGKTL
ncbi:MAG: metallopeptidase family protein, partial [Candidatus Paceibacterota bacterium]